MPHDIPFALARVDAINAYARLEYWLSGIMRELIGCDPETGQLIFHTIVNTRARYAIISTLARKRHDGQYHRAWKTIENWLTPVDAERNKIVHWVEEFTTEILDYETIPEDRRSFAKAKDITLLRNAKNKFNFHNREGTLTEEDLVTFTNHVRDINEVLELLFRALMLHEKKPWWNKFHKAKTNLSPKELRQFLIDREPPNPPQSSQA